MKCQKCGYIVPVGTAITKVENKWVCDKCGEENEFFNDYAQPKADNKVKNHASTHYELWSGTEAIDVIKQMLTPEEYRGFLKGNILKYQLRLGKKDAVEKEMIKIKDYQRELNESLTSSSN